MSRHSSNTDTSDAEKEMTDLIHVEIKLVSTNTGPSSWLVAKTVIASFDIGIARNQTQFKEATAKMRREPIETEEMIHNLFGDHQKHCQYRVYVSSFQKDYHYTFEAFDQEKMC
ncbi:hypothetical protein TNIN_285171 [Trichonephila inaurata madagascariensis]|uniref:Uncharacterized protein n=1 Tax=Trichonephila inaurata madagascariensis TaxID=2747483 RepID=A0A8X7BZZ0_9ARAC|nr:hypothetical protein TNIN_285171 [Trichonephila inaurata madagascariensis]